MTSPLEQFADAVDAALRNLRSPNATRGLRERRAELNAAGAALVAAERERIRLLAIDHEAEAFAPERTGNVVPFAHLITEETP